MLIELAEPLVPADRLEIRGVRRARHLEADDIAGVGRTALFDAGRSCAAGLGPPADGLVIGQGMRHRRFCEQEGYHARNASCIFFRCG